MTDIKYKLVKKPLIEYLEGGEWKYIPRNEPEQKIRNSSESGS